MEGFNTPVLARKVILVESDANLAKLYSQNLELYVGCEVIVKKNADEVTDFLKHGEEIDLIVSENMAGDEYTVLKIYYYVNSQKLNIPIILMGKNPKLTDKVEMIDKEEWKVMIKRAAELVKITAQDMIELEVPQYYPIPIAALRGISSVSVNLYTYEDGQYNIMTPASSPIDASKFDELILKNLSYIFVESSNRLDFAQSFNTHISALLRDKDLKPEDRVSITAVAFDNAALMLGTKGVSDQAISASQDTINSMVKIAIETPSLDSLLGIVQRDQESFLFKHSLMISILSHFIIGEMEWGNEDQRNKICFAAFFHDVTLNDDKLCQIGTLEEFESADLSDEEKEKVLNHAFDACQLLKKFPKIPYGAEDLILKHHGIVSGRGFPESETLPTGLSHLSMVFIILEEYVHYLLKLEGASCTAILDEMQLKYDKGKYKNIFKALVKAHKK